MEQSTEIPQAPVEFEVDYPAVKLRTHVISTPKLLQRWARDLTALGWTQTAIGNAVGCSHSIISDIYNGLANDVYFSVGYTLMKLHEQVKTNQQYERDKRKTLAKLPLAARANKRPRATKPKPPAAQ